MLVKMISSSDMPAMIFQVLERMSPFSCSFWENEVSCSKKAGYSSTSSLRELMNYKVLNSDHLNLNINYDSTLS